MTVLFTDLHVGTTQITYYLHAHNSVSTLKFIFGICNKGTRIGVFKIISKYFSENKKKMALFIYVNFIENSHDLTRHNVTHFFVTNFPYLV